MNDASAQHTVTQVYIHLYRAKQDSQSSMAELHRPALFSIRVASVLTCNFLEIGNMTKRQNNMEYIHLASVCAFFPFTGGFLVRVGALREDDFGAA